MSRTNESTRKKKSSPVRKRKKKKKKKRFVVSFTFSLGSGVHLDLPKKRWETRTHKKLNWQVDSTQLDTSEICWIYFFLHLFFFFLSLFSSFSLVSLFFSLFFPFHAFFRQQKNAKDPLILSVLSSFSSPCPLLPLFLFLLLAREQFTLFIETDETNLCLSIRSKESNLAPSENERRHTHEKRMRGWGGKEHLSLPTSSPAFSSCHSQKSDPNARFSFSDSLCHWTKGNCNSQDINLCPLFVSSLLLAHTDMSLVMHTHTHTLTSMYFSPVSSSLFFVFSLSLSLSLSPLKITNWTHTLSVSLNLLSITVQFTWTINCLSLFLPLSLPAIHSWDTRVTRTMAKSHFSSALELWAEKNNQLAFTVEKERERERRKKESLHPASSSCSIIVKEK